MSAGDRTLYKLLLSARNLFHNSGGGVTVLRWHLVEEQKRPQRNEPVLVRCESYDADYQGGFEIASYHAPSTTEGEHVPEHWTTGKQEVEVHPVYAWAYIRGEDADGRSYEI